VVVVEEDDEEERPVLMLALFALFWGEAQRVPELGPCFIFDGDDEAEVFPERCVPPVAPNLGNDIISSRDSKAS